MFKYPKSDLVYRHRLSLSQINHLGWEEVTKEELINEKVRALADLSKTQITLDQLKASGVFFILFKGVALSQRIYQDPTYRICKDLDILIPERSEVSKIRTELLKFGWKDAEGDWIEDQPRQDWYMSIAFHHCMVHPDGTWLEIHWSLDNLFFDFSDAKKRSILESNITTLSVLNREVNVLSPELELAYLLTHGARHAWFRLKWLVDIYHYPVSLVDSGKFEMISKEFGVSHLVYHVDYLLNHFFGGKWPFSDLKAKSSFLSTYSIKRIEGVEKGPDLSISDFTSYLIHQSFVLKRPKSVLKFLFSGIGVRPFDVKEVRLDSFWKYFFYRYYSLIRRKLID